MAICFPPCVAGGWFLTGCAVRVRVLGVEMETWAESMRAPPKDEQVVLVVVVAAVVMISGRNGRVSIVRMYVEGSKADVKIDTTYSIRNLEVTTL